MFAARRPPNVFSQIARNVRRLRCRACTHGLTYLIRHVFRIRIRYNRRCKHRGKRKRHERDRSCTTLGGELTIQLLHPQPPCRYIHRTNPPDSIAPVSHSASS